MAEGFTTGDNTQLDMSPSLTLTFLHKDHESYFARKIVLSSYKLDLKRDMEDRSSIKTKYSNEAGAQVVLLLTNVF